MKIAIKCYEKVLATPLGELDGELYREGNDLYKVEVING